MCPSATRALCLMGSLLALTHASPLQVVLADTGAPLTPQEEAAFFSRHPEAASYRVLRWEAGAVRARRVKREVNTDSSLRLHLPLPPGHLELVLEKNSIVAPDLDSWSHNASAAENEAQVLADCFYSGGSSVSWAVISTCDGLSGLLLHHGKTYRLEELPPSPLHHHHHHGDPDLPLLVIFPLSTASTDTSDTTNPTSLRSQAHTEMPHIRAGEQRTHTRGHRMTRAVRRRVTRKSSNKYTMELAVYIDDSLVSHIQKRYPKANPKDKAKEIVMTLLNVVSRLFSDPSLGAVSVKLAVMMVKFLSAGVVRKAGGDGNKYLSNFCVWQAESTRKSKQSDHALLLTGVDLYSGEPQATSTTGMSFIGGMCSLKHSCSIVEGTKFTSAFTIAHEIGHNMNLVHDGEKKAASCSKKGHLMATSLNDGGHTWSSCSKNHLSDFLRNQGTCLAEESGEAMLTYPIPDEELPGIKFDADQQCHYMFGKGWSHTPDHHPDVCKEIWCFKGLRLRSPGVSPLDGTTCGHNKVCIRGRCKSFRAKKNHQYRSSTKKQPGEGKGKKPMKKIVKRLMNKVKKKTRPRHEKKKDEVLEEMEDRNDEGRKYNTGNSSKGENDDDTSEENTEKQIRPSSKYVKLLEKVMKEAKKSIKRIKDIKDKNSAKIDGKAKEGDEIMEIFNNKTREVDVNDREDLRHDKNEKKQEKNQKLKRIIKQQVKKRLNFINRRGRVKDLSKIRKIESPTQIVIKERLNYVKDKGWKVNVLKIKKTKKMANRRVRVKDYTITCNGAQSQCKITTKRARKSNRMRQPPTNKGNERLPLNASKKTNTRLGKEHQTISVLTRRAALAREQCRPRRVQYVNGKGWLVKVSHHCLRLHQMKKEEAT